jgi:antitoxin CcdA
MRIQKGEFMQTEHYNHEAPKKAVNLSINSDLLAQAKQNHINLSKSLEEILEKHLQKLSQQKWLKQNQEAIEQYNNRVEKKGVFSNNLRQF